MAQWALQFTPEVCLGQWPGSILLEVQPSLKLWGGQEALLERLRNGFEQLGWGRTQCQFAWAPTARAADWRVAWGSQADLSELPLACIPELEPHLASLQAMGLHQLKGLLRLPRVGLSRRLGAQTLAALDAGFGDRPDPREQVQLPPQFSQTLEFALPTHESPFLLEAGRRLLEGCVAWLQARQAGLQEAHFTLYQGHRAQQTLTIRLADPSQDLARIRGILAERLAHEPLAAPVHAMQIDVTQIEPVSDTTPDLFEGPSRPHRSLRQLCERLQARLGADQVVRLGLADRHRPEAAMVLNPDQPWASRSARSPSRHAALPPQSAESPRPTWLLESPEPLGLHQQRPCYQGPLRLRAGPERIEAEWWSEPLQRDYFVAETSDQRLVWVFRNPQHEWFLHGFFG